MSTTTHGDIEEVVRMVAAADGELVGRTRLQKTAFLLELAGLGSGYRFSYKHYGPFSEDLASAVDVAPLLFDFEETQKRSGWGGTYSVFSSHAQYEGDGDDPYRMLVSVAKSANPIALELAATAAYLASVGEADPWAKLSVGSQRKQRMADLILPRHCTVASRACRFLNRSQTFRVITSTQLSVSWQAKGRKHHSTEQRRCKKTMSSEHLFGMQRTHCVAQPLIELIGKATSFLSCFQADLGCLGRRNR